MFFESKRLPCEGQPYEKCEYGETVLMDDYVLHASDLLSLEEKGPSREGGGRHTRDWFRI
jgi:hypothetical protein